MYYILFQILIQEHFVLSLITCVNSMEMSYIPIAKARGFTTYWISKFSTSSSGNFTIPKLLLEFIFSFYRVPDTGSIISACTKLERSFEAPEAFSSRSSITALLPNTSSKPNFSKSLWI